ncbi:hypothetical protein [Vibrio scophthalmi]|uniref:Uncharacterized protein n=1 Tax=Vibrio scophthalmi TaxID=45658 RepID=A0A1E3WIR0_9VIBR|nr:hypothetical protein [Vibrio scophthalmi]ODS09633.1 hypothetical protein VSF3289_03297 [Vibrio scophthalmi]
MTEQKEPRTFKQEIILSLAGAAGLAAGLGLAYFLIWGYFLAPSDPLEILNLK